MGTKRLNKIVAVERDVKKTAYNDLSKTHNLIQKPATVNGSLGEYTPANEGGEVFPPENKLIQMHVEEELKIAAMKNSPYFDLVLSKDVGNTKAFAELTLPDGQSLGKLPVPTLLFLEKQLLDFKTFFEKLPTLSPDHAWNWDNARGFYATAPVRTIKTAKSQEPIVMYQATPEHPAQTQLITKDVIVGSWSRTHISGAITEKRRKALVERTETLLRLVKQAREEANLVEVEELQMGEKIFSYLLGNAQSDA